MDSFYGIFFLSNHIYSLSILYQLYLFMSWFSCRHLDPVSMIFALSLQKLTCHVNKTLRINVHRCLRQDSGVPERGGELIRSGQRPAVDMAAGL
jgi:polyferredoxin